MPAHLTDRDSLERAFYRLTGTASSDGALTEHDDTSKEAVLQLLQQGVWDAQEILISFGRGEFWTTQSSTLSFTDVELTQGGSYASLPTDFLRLAGTEDLSALRRPKGESWGRQVPQEWGRRLRGSKYWIEDGKLWVSRGADPPSDLVMDYYYEHPELEASTEVDFPKRDRPLIVACAAMEALAENWFPEPNRKTEIIANFRLKRAHAWRNSRTSRGPRRIQREPTIGTHYFAGF